MSPEKGKRAAGGTFLPGDNGESTFPEKRSGLAEGERPSARHGLWLALVGILAASLSAALFLCTDSLRADWPLSEPRITAGLPILLVIYFASILADELLGRGVTDNQYSIPDRIPLPGLC